VIVRGVPNGRVGDVSFGHGPVRVVSERLGREGVQLDGKRMGESGAVKTDGLPACAGANFYGIQLIIVVEHAF